MQIGRVASRYNQRYSDHSDQPPAGRQSFVDPLLTGSSPMAVPSDFRPLLESHTRVCHQALEFMAHLILHAFACDSAAASDRRWV